MAPPNARTRFFYTALAAALLAYGVVVINAYTRLSDAGPNYTVWLDQQSRQPAPAIAEDINSVHKPFAILDYNDGPWELRVHPFLMAALAVLILRLGYLGWGLAQHKGGRHLVFPIIIFVLLFTLVLPDITRASLQHQLSTRMVQLAGTLSILTLLWWLVMREQRFWKSVEETPLTRVLRPRVIVAFVIVVVQSVLGGWSNVSQAGLPCADFPTCQGVWWPAMDFTEVFSNTGYVIDVSNSEASNPSVLTLHMLHRLGAMITLLYVGWLAMYVFLACIEGNLCRYGLFVLILLVSQVSLGIMAVVTYLPLTTTLAHSAVSALLLLSILTLYHVVRPPGTATRRSKKRT